MSNDDLIKEHQRIDIEVFGVSNLNDDGTLKTDDDVADEPQDIIFVIRKDLNEVKSDLRLHLNNTESNLRKDILDTKMLVVNMHADFYSKSELVLGLFIVNIVLLVIILTK